jgi:hypothetical protein
VFKIISQRSLSMDNRSEWVTSVCKITTLHVTVIWLISIPTLRFEVRVDRNILLQPFSTFHLMYCESASSNESTTSTPTRLWEDDLTISINVININTLTERVYIRGRSHKALHTFFYQSLVNTLKSQAER